MDGGRVSDDLEPAKVSHPQMRPIQPRPLLGLSGIEVLHDTYPVT